MPLSEHEKRLLDEIEQTLRLDDPALASSLRSARPRTRTPTFVLIAFAGLVIGFVLLFTALRLHGAASPVLGVAGFGLIVAGTDTAIRVGQRVRAPRRNSNDTRGAVGPTT
jgi:hypothetical protein